MNDGRIEQDDTPEAVVEHPATPFVMTFVGQVNIFHGRGYARPHELDVSRTDAGDGLWATVRDVRATGAVVKIELVDEAGAVIHVESSREQFDASHVRVGERAYVRPRRLRHFTPV